MVERIGIRLNCAALPRERITARSYTDRGGVEHHEKTIDIDVVALKKQKLIKSYQKADHVKTHSVQVRQTKEERDRGDEVIYIGEGTQFIKREEIDNGDDW